MPDHFAEDPKRLGPLKTLFTRGRGKDQFGAGRPLYLQVSGDGDSFFMLYQVDEDKGNRTLMVVERWNGHQPALAAQAHVS